VYFYIIFLSYEIILSVEFTLLSVTTLDCKDLLNYLSGLLLQGLNLKRN